MVLESPEYMPLISEPSTKLGLSRGSVSVFWVNELTARFYRLWTQMPSEAKQTVQMNEVGDGNNRQCWGLHVLHSKGQPLFSSGHLLPCGDVDHLLPHLIFQEKPKSRLLWWAPDFFMLWTNFKLFKLSEGQTKHICWLTTDQRTCLELVPWNFRMFLMQWQWFCWKLLGREVKGRQRKASIPNIHKPILFGQPLLQASLWERPKEQAGTPTAGGEWGQMAFELPAGLVIGFSYNLNPHQKRI